MAQATRTHFENFNIIGILQDHKRWYENDPTQGVAGATMTVTKISEIQKKYLDFIQQQHTSILTHYENFMAILAKYEQATGNEVSESHRAQKFITPLS
jgi:phenylacetate-coenzyme A ligase PaaK-like adenylate-forming protein